MGLQLQQWSANGGTNQMWFLRPTGDGFYTIVGRANGLLADVSAASTGDGAQVYLTEHPEDPSGENADAVRVFAVAALLAMTEKPAGNAVTLSP